MTRKDYVALAEAFRQAHELNELRRPRGSDYYPTRNGIGLAQERVADMLAKDNPRFDRARFDTACERRNAATGAEVLDSDGTFTEDDRGNWRKVSE